MTEELVARMESALKDATDSFEEQVNRIVEAMDQKSSDELRDLVREILDHVRSLRNSGEGF